jgi:hypothetical protein
MAPPSGRGGRETRDWWSWKENKPKVIRKTMIE